MIRFPVIEKESDFDLTPLLSSCEYQGPVTSFMPLMTCRFAFCEDAGLRIDLSSFEDEPTVCEDILDGHLVGVAFCLFPETSNTVIQLVADSTGRCFMYKDGALSGEHPCTLSHGEDERGLAWTVSIVLTKEEISSIYGTCSFEAGSYVLGNAYKCKLTAPGKHFGAIAPLREGCSLFSKEHLTRIDTILI